MGFLYHFIEISSFLSKFKEKIIIKIETKIKTTESIYGLFPPSKNGGRQSKIAIIKKKIVFCFFDFIIWCKIFLNYINNIFY